MAATQKPIIGSAFSASVDQAAWKTIPSWYLVTKDDRAINPELEQSARSSGANWARSISDRRAAR